MTTPQPSPARSLPRRCWPLLILLAAVGVYLGTLTHGFVFDDEIAVVDNPYIRSLNVVAIFGLPEGTRSGLHQLYRPLLNVTLALNHALTGLEPWSYHVFNILLHALVSVLVFFLARAWRLSPPAALVGALLFAVHPIHVEVVANVVGRKDALVAAFVVGTAILHARALRRGGAWMAAPVACFLGAVFSKENGLVALGLVGLQDVLLGGGENGQRPPPRRRVLMLYGAYAAALAGFLWARWSVVGAFGLSGIGFYDNPLAHAPAAVRLMSAVVVIGKGLAVQAWPVSQSPDYSFNAIPLVYSPVDPRLLISIGAIATVAALAVAAWRRANSILAMSAAWYFAAVLPTANLLYPVGTIFGERLLYLPSVGVCLLWGWALDAACPRHRRQIFAGAAVLVLGVMGLQTVRYGSAWSSDLTLFDVAVRHAPGSAKTHYKLGELLVNAGRREEALREMQRAVEIAPENEFTLYGLGTALRDLNRLDEARDVWLRLLQLRPNHAASLGDLGTYFSVKGDYARSISYSERAVSVDPSLATSWYNLGVLYRATGRPASAVHALQEFIRVADARTYRREIEQARAMIGALR
jgi:tetratricopeptide (TPR) repeat protein